MHYTYRTSGTCSQAIEFDMDDTHTLSNVTFHGGCPGNLLGIGHLTEGKKAEDIIEALQGVRCGMKSTSCPDQLSIALRKALEKENEKSD